MQFGFGGKNWRDFSGEGDNEREKRARDYTKYRDAAKKTKRGVLIACVVLLAYVLISGAYYRVDEKEQAVVTQFGKVIATHTAGLYFKLPFIQTVRKVDTTTKGLQIGYTSANESGAASESVTAESLMITSDFNFVNIDFYLEYRVSDPVKYIFHSTQPDEILRNITQASIRSTIVNYPVDDVITTGKGQIQADVKEKLVKELEEQDLGLSVVNISIQDAEPPTEAVVAAFKAVETAKQGKETAVNNANRYRNEQIPAANAEADRILQEAEGEKEARIAEAEGQVARFDRMYEEYENYPLITKRRLFYEALEETLPALKVIITDGATETMLPLESFFDGTDEAAKQE